MLQIVQYSATTKGSAEKVFAIWKDVPNWPVWDTYLKASTLQGECKPGARGTMTPKFGIKLNFVIVNLVPDRRFDNTANIPGGRMYFDHEVEPTADGGAKITHTISVGGPLAPFWRAILKQSLLGAVHSATTQLAQLAET